MGTGELERLCVGQLGGGPWFFSERIRGSRAYPVPDRPDYKLFSVQRLGSMRYVHEDRNTGRAEMRGEDRGPLYVEGHSWEDCAAQLGLNLTTEDSR